MQKLAPEKEVNRKPPSEENIRVTLQPQVASPVFDVPTMHIHRMPGGQEGFAREGDLRRSYHQAFAVPRFLVRVCAAPAYEAMFCRKPACPVAVARSRRHQDATVFVQYPDF